MARAKPPLSLKGRALALLAQREHSEAELRRKLRRHEGDAEADELAIAARLDEVIAWLREHHFLSEERFIESRVHARAARYGNLRIRQELAQHGLRLGTDAAQALKDTELQRALAVWQRKFAHPAAGRLERAKQSRFLAQRGFSAETIARVMREAGRSTVTEDATRDPPLDDD
jgi:regulatory protein